MSNFGGRGPFSGQSRGGMADFPGLVREQAPASTPTATTLPEGVTERVVVMVAVLTHSTPAQIRVALSPTPHNTWVATAVYAGADVATAQGQRPELALLALEQRVARDATLQCDALSSMLDAWQARNEKKTPPVAYESEEP